MNWVKHKAKIALVILIGICFASTLASAMTFEGGYTLTKEQAIETSLKSNTVQWFMLRARSFSLEVFYLNRTQVNNAREELTYGQEEFPENRSIWKVAWFVRTWANTNSSFEIITHTIDYETGMILYEGQGGAR